MESSEFAKILAKIAGAAIIAAGRSYEEARRQYEAFEACKLEDGKYDRRKIEHIEGYEPPQELDLWLDELLIDAALDKRDKATFEHLTAMARF
ncbi:IDEAL domain-containing protein [Metasolibacillus meyeri]|uniref:IDEAL domain-containing protein n=1 Tax=Metasolibacillus meyeri TaxID=1071052 RepID=A0AAW9NLK8_9BACL|nr:IDEAL domain-containing protein [Metasolibacillus meyeri]MEC1178517.1 IDEAL domain-containing protein [Metasolibacillus meyeri]